jgi:cell division protein FtsZ
MRGQGEAILGIGSAQGEDKALTAVDSALHSPFLNSYDLTDAKSILINIAGPKGIKLKETNIILQKIYEIGSEANIVFGITQDESLNDELKVTLIVTGFTRTQSAKKTFSQSQSFTLDDYLNQVKQNQTDDNTKLPNFIDKQEEEDDDFDIPAFLKKKIN